jgi:PAS domain S-box-containing protein
MHDLDGQLIGVNPAASRLLGFTAAELEGRKIQEFMLPEFRPQFHGRYMEVVMAGGASQGVFVIQDKAEGRHYLEYRATRVDPPNGPPYVTASGRDITERVLAERELRRLEEQLFQAQKMEAIGTLASGISHDFNNILQAMGGYIHLLLTREGMDEASRRHLVEMDEAVDRAAELVHQLLTFSRRLKPDFKVIDLNRLVAQTAAMLRRTIPKMVHVITDLDPDLPVIQGDTGQLSQVLMNLGTNARDAMPDGGRLWIETQGIHYSGASDTPGLDLPPGRYVQMTVADTGHGMDDETVSHIFEPFFTTKDVGEGTGLGLSTVYGIVQSHGGRINCRSRPGEGTRFTILLPARIGTDVLERPCVPTSPLRGGNETILVVDDEYQIREVVREVLSDQGYQVLTAGGGESALRIFRERGHRVDLVLLDLGMPGMGGRECLKRLRQMAPGLRVIVASGYASNGAIDEVLNDGANRFLPKPYRLAQLLSVIRTVIDGEENGNPPIR